ncbi:unnamed protein product [Arctia plantaginis]|uniref:Uncharacterized protein n=1 Tax=Arctia plantaginis TaxID=874455 RepID=A0A8S0Z879_ARCPL|nr:unnamed protein product [Arctia plantaginis]CAB3228160.1 unnamed protein product [Arctia plantaginis]
MVWHGDEGCIDRCSAALNKADERLVSAAGLACSNMHRAAGGGGAPRTGRHSPNTRSPVCRQAGSHLAYVPYIQRYPYLDDPIP